MEDNMKIQIEIFDDDGESIWWYEGDLHLPKELKTPVDRPFKYGKYRVYGFTFQPIVKVKLEGQ